MFFKKKKEEHDLENWELYPDYLEAIEAVKNFDGAKWTTKVTTTKKKDSVETVEEDVMTPEYAALIAEKDKFVAAAENYRNTMVAKTEAEKKESYGPKIVAAAISGVFGFGSTMLAIGGKHWLEKHDSYDDGGVLTDVEKEAIKTNMRKTKN